MAEKYVKAGTGNEKTVYGIKTTQYLQPELITTYINEKMRAEKEEEVGLW